MVNKTHTLKELLQGFYSIVMTSFRGHSRCKSLEKTLKSLTVIFFVHVFFYDILETQTYPQMLISLEVWNIFLEAMFHRIRLITSL